MTHKSIPVSISTLCAPEKSSQKWQSLAACVRLREDSDPGLLTGGEPLKAHPLYNRTEVICDSRVSRDKETTTISLNTLPIQGKSALIIIYLIHGLNLLRHLSPLSRRHDSSEVFTIPVGIAYMRPYKGS